jgi:activator of HSP90 ATPase
MDKQGIDKPVFGMDKQGIDKPVFGMDKQGIDKPVFGMDKRDINIDQKSKNNMDILLGDKSLKKEYNSDPLKKNNNMQSDGNDIYVPNCTAISNDILNNRIKQKNYLYLSPKCNKQILNALINS